MNLVFKKWDILLIKYQNFSSRVGVVCSAHWSLEKDASLDKIILQPKKDAHDAH
jgi:hypothetical protein